LPLFGPFKFKFTFSTSTKINYSNLMMIFFHFLLLDYVCDNNLAKLAKNTWFSIWFAISRNQVTPSGHKHGKILLEWKCHKAQTNIHNTKIKTIIKKMLVTFRKNIQNKLNNQIILDFSFCNQLVDSQD
jgi:hypothetical protein